MRFYVNELRDNQLREKLGVKWPYNIIALFGEYEWDGVGNFCGWYGAEYFLDTKVYAYYIADATHFYDPKQRVSDVTVCNPCLEYERVGIGSCSWTTVIEADSVEEAIEKFKNFEWKREYKCECKCAWKGRK